MLYGVYLQRCCRTGWMIAGCIILGLQVQADTASPPQGVPPTAAAPLVSPTPARSNLPPTTAPLAKPAPRPTGITEQCANDVCHAALMARKVMHGPTAQKKCQACHEYEEPRAHRFKLASAQEKLCGDCHALKHRTNLHAPVKQGNCTGCHDPHGSDYKKMLVADPTSGLCLKCHKQAGFAGKKFIHGPVATGACIVCHEPHSSWQPKLLVDVPSKLCLGCHGEVSPKGDKARHVHAPVKDNCTGCHDPHASDAKFQLRQTAPDLCLSCHKEMAKTLASAKVVHGAVQQAGGCLGCHMPHFSALPKLQRAVQPASCLGCHDRPLKDASGKELTNMAAFLKENPQQHGPIREGACTACHQPHAGDRFRLLTAEYPAEFYAPFKLEQYGLCFSCHIPDLVLKAQGTGLTRFRNGDVNLHQLHVNQEKGRTCRACHEVHASQRPFHIREGVPFGTKGWMLEINYQQNADGGSCSPGCHKTRSYQRGEAGKADAGKAGGANGTKVEVSKAPATQEATR